MLDNITDTDLFKGIASLVTGGAFVGWYREHRKARKDEQNFALEFMKKQSLRIDKLVQEVAELKADNRISQGELESSRQLLASVRAELLISRAETAEANHEIVRLKTALGEYSTRGTATTTEGN